MKIFQVVPYYPPHVGGMEFYVKGLSEELVRLGHDVTVFTSSETATQTVYEINGVKVFSLKVARKIYNIPIVPTLFNQLMYAKKPDIIHTHQYPIFFSDTCAAVCALRKIPLLVHVHVVSDAKSVISGLVSDMYYKTLGLRTLQTADTVIVPSLSYKERISKMHINPTRIEVIPYGIDTEKFSAGNATSFKKKYGLQSSRVVLSVGRLNYQKGFQYLVKAMPNIIRQIPEVKLVIVGEGEQRTYLQELVSMYGINKNVIFTGALSQAQICDAYYASDVFVLPSLFESFGISLIEAQAAGKPVVGTRTGGVPEALINEETGILVEPKNVKQIETAIIRILLNEKLATKMSDKGKVFSKRFSIKQLAPIISSQYEKLVTD